jgi:hypothetical protein
VSAIVIKQSTLTLIFSLLLIQTHCEPSNEGICEALATEINRSYEENINKNIRLQMLMQYEDLDCGPLSMKNSFELAN